MSDTHFLKTASQFLIALQIEEWFFRKLQSVACLLACLRVLVLFFFLGSNQLPVPFLFTILLLPVPLLASPWMLVHCFHPLNPPDACGRQSCSLFTFLLRVTIFQVGQSLVFVSCRRLHPQGLSLPEPEGSIPYCVTRLIAFWYSIFHLQTFLFPSSLQFPICSPTIACLC